MKTQLLCTFTNTKGLSTGDLYVLNEKDGTKTIKMK